MALSDLKTLITVKADVSQAKSEIKSLRGVERQAAQERLGELESQNSRIEKTIAFYGKLAAGIALGVGAYQSARAAANSYFEDMRLESSARGADLAALKKATHGLVEADNLLAFAGKTMHGVWKLNQGEMETVLRGAMALRKTMGVELQPTIEKLTEALTKGNTKALRDLGIEAKDKMGVLRELDDLFGALGGNVSLAGDEMQATGVKMTDAFDDIKGAIGQLVVALGPAIDLLSAGVVKLAWIINHLPGGNGPTPSQLGRGEAGVYERFTHFVAGLHGRDLGRELKYGDDENEALARQHGSMRRQIVGQNDADRQRIAKQVNDAAIETLLNVQAVLVRAQIDAAARKGGSPKDGRYELNFAEANGFSGWSTLSEKFEHEEWLKGAGSRSAWAAIGEDTKHGQRSAQGISGSISEGSSAIESMLAQWAEMDAAKAAEGNLLARIFGTPAEIEEMAAMIDIAASSFDMLTGAATAAFDAWITGSKSIGAAFKEAIADGLRANATQMLAESIKHAAFALGSWAFGNFVSAKAHGAAALKFAGGAAVMGVLAKQLGEQTGQWSGAGAGAGSAAGAGIFGAPRTIGNGGSQQGGDNITVYVGAEWAAMSSIDQASSINRALQLGKRGSPHIRRN
jgi:hypothetical protein